MKLSAQQILHCWSTYLGSESGPKLQRVIANKIVTETSDTILLDWLKELGLQCPQIKTHITFDKDVQNESDYAVSSSEWNDLKYVLNAFCTIRLEILNSGEYLILNQSTQVYTEHLGKLIYCFRGAVTSYPYYPETAVGKMFYDYLTTQNSNSIELIARRYSMSTEVTQAFLGVLMLLFVDSSRRDLIEGFVKTLPDEPLRLSMIPKTRRSRKHD